MKKSQTVILDGNEAAALIAHKTNEVIAIYPITPSSPMGELADAWSARHVKNLFGSVPLVQEMQSEGGAAGALHGALQTGALTTTFSASQGLLLMLPNMYKIAGELTPAVIHVAARSIASQALSIFGDHSDVMAARATGFAMLASASVQEAMDFALISQSASLKSRIPFLHFFDGFRTSHEIKDVEELGDEDIHAMIDLEDILAHRERSLSPDRPVIRGTAQNPDVFFQAREAANPYYQECPGIVQEMMDRFARLTGRQYRLFDYAGHPEAERVIVLMGSGAECVEETVDHFVSRGEPVGVVKVRLYRPFSAAALTASLPAATRSIAVLDRTKEPGSAGEPLYQDILAGLFEQGSAAGFEKLPQVVGGRYGLSSKEFTPAMVRAVFENLAEDSPRKHFTVGIHDDVTHSSLSYDPDFIIESEQVKRAVFFGLGSDGTVSANKNSIKIIGKATGYRVQGYFVYDSKKAGSVTVSHLRFGPQPIRSPYLIERAHFLGCHQFNFLDRIDVLERAQQNAVFLLNSPFGAENVWEKLPAKVQAQIIDKNLQFWVIDAYEVAQRSGLNVRINTIMQTCFFALTDILPGEEAVRQIKNSIKETYGKQGQLIVERNFQAVDAALEAIHQVRVPKTVTSDIAMWDSVPAGSSEFVRNVTSRLMEGKGDLLPVSCMPPDGTFPVGTARFEKRNIATEIPVWDPAVCIQCGKCALVCPHSVIRIKAYEPSVLEKAPSTFKSVVPRDRDWAGLNYTIQVAPEDCTGCALCVDFCPARNKSETRLKAINMEPQPPIREQEKENWDFFLGIPELPRDRVRINLVKQSQVLEPLFEFSGACAGCGETPYIKLMSQLYGDRALVANATGCSSIYGGNLPTTPWTKNSEGRGPAWANSLFEDNAEFGLGFRLSINKQRDLALELVQQLESELGRDLVEQVVSTDQSDEASIFEQRQRVGLIKERAALLLQDSVASAATNRQLRLLLSVADMLVKKSVWIIGGDGWAYDIGFGGLDHVVASGADVNILILDTEVYSNTGGQMSKSTPRAAVAKFAAGGKLLPKKDLARMMMTYGSVYVATVAMGARDEHTLRVFLEAEAYQGPSLILAYSHCIAHGINMTTAMQDQKAAVLSGAWPLFRYNPDLIGEGKNPFQLDSRKPQISLKDYAYRANRYRMLTKTDPLLAQELLELAQADIDRQWQIYEAMAAAPSGD